MRNSKTVEITKEEFLERAKALKGKNCDDVWCEVCIVADKIFAEVDKKVYCEYHYYFMPDEVPQDDSSRNRFSHNGHKLIEAFDDYTQHNDHGCFNDLKFPYQLTFEVE